MNPEDLLLLVTRAMPFGKHKGTLIADLPGNYGRYSVVARQAGFGVKPSLQWQVSSEVDRPVVAVMQS